MIETNSVVHQLLPDALEWFDRKRLRKEISEILIREDMRDTEIALLHILTDARPACAKAPCGRRSSWILRCKSNTFVVSKKVSGPKFILLLVG